MSELRQHDLFVDLPRGIQLDLLRKLQLPDVKLDDRNIKAVVLKAVLYRIDDRANPRCWASQALLARDANCSAKTVACATKALEQLDLIARADERSGRTKEYAIAWGTVSMLVSNQSTPTTTPDPGLMVLPTQDHGSEGVGPMVLVTLDHVSGGVGPMVLQNDKETQTLNASSSSSETQTMTKVVCSTWQDAETALSEVGLQRIAQAIDIAKREGIEPAEVCDLTFIVRHTSDLSPGAIIARLRDGCWPVDDVPDAETIRRRLSGQSVAQGQQRDQRADIIRSGVIREARSRKPEPPPSWVVDGMIARRLDSEGLGDLATDKERAAADRLDAIDAAKNEL